MKGDARGRLRTHAGKIMACGTGALLTVSALSLATAVIGEDSVEAETRAKRLVTTLEGDRAQAESSLRAKHQKLVGALSGVDSDRAARDAAVGRAVLLSLTDPSVSTREVPTVQATLDARYEFLTPASRTLTEFIPQWAAISGSASDEVTTYALAGLDIDVSSVLGLDYGYVGVSRFDPVSTDEPGTAKSEFVMFTFTTTQDGSVTDFEASRASSRTRDALIAGDAHETGKHDSAPRVGG